MKRRLLLFLINNEVILEDSCELTAKEVEMQKCLIASECGCKFDDVEVRFEDVHFEQEMSNIDVNSLGLVNWLDPYVTILQGIKPNININSDEFLDSIINNTFCDHLNLVG